MRLGKLEFTDIHKATNLVADPVMAMVDENGLAEMYVTEINPDVSDTAAFCAEYEVGLDISANCVIIEAKRADKIWYAACMILATDKVDVNGIVRRQLGAKRTSFAPMDTTVSLTGMEYGGITPIGLPSDWPILVDTKVANLEWAIIGGGIRKSKLVVGGQLLAELPNAIILNIRKEI